MLRIRQQNKSHQKSSSSNQLFFSQVSLEEATTKLQTNLTTNAQSQNIGCSWQIQEQPKHLVFPSSCLLLYMEKSNYGVWATCENRENSLSLGDDGNGVNIILRTY